MPKFSILSVQFMCILPLISGLECDGDKLLRECGGVVNTSSGIIWYKPFEPLTSFEVCTWTLKKLPGQSLHLALLHDGFVESDYPTNPVLVQVIYITDNGIIANYPNITELKSNDRNTYNFTDQNIYLLRFIAYGSNGTGKGFALQFSITGTARKSEIVYKNYHSREFNGGLDYFPSKESNELLTYVTDPQVPFIMFTYFHNITVPGICPEGPDLFSMHALTGTTSLQRRFCNTMMNTTERLGTQRNPHVVIYRSDAKNWRVGNGFSFSWS